MLYFLSLADSHAFNKALLLRILKEIAKFEFGMTASNLNHTMLKLRLLAKFLGVLTFGHHLKDLDAMWDPKFGESAADQCRIYQGELLDPLRVLNRLRSAYADGRLVVTLPWLVEYIAMLRGDAVTLQVPYYQALLEQLAQISAAVQTADVYAPHTRLRLLVAELVTGLFDSLQLPYPTYNHAHKIVWLAIGCQDRAGRLFDSRILHLADPPSLPPTATDLAVGIVSQDMLEQASQRVIEIREMLEKATPLSARPEQTQRGLKGFASSRGTRRLPKDQLKQVMNGETAGAGGAPGGTGIIPVASVKTENPNPSRNSARRH